MRDRDSFIGTADRCDATDSVIVKRGCERERPGRQTRRRSRGGKWDYRHSRLLQNPKGREPAFCGKKRGWQRTTATATAREHLFLKRHIEHSFISFDVDAAPTSWTSPSTPSTCILLLCCKLQDGIAKRIQSSTTNYIKRNRSRSIEN